MSTTMNHVLLEPLSPAWHSWRADGIGGSDAPVIAADAGLCRPAAWMKSLDVLWKVKTRRVADFGGNWATRRGTRAEPIARAAFENATGILLAPLYGEMRDFPVIRSSFDGVDFYGNIIGECKLGSTHVHTLVKDNQIPEYYQPQLAHQALTAWGMPEAWKPEHTIAFISHQIETGETIWVIKPALKFRELAEPLIKKELEFWDRVQKDAEPCGEDWKKAANEYLAIRTSIDAMKEDMEAAENKLIELLGSAKKMSAAGVSVSRQLKTGGIDYAKLLSERTQLTAADIEAYRKPESASTVIRVLK